MATCRRFATIGSALTVFVAALLSVSAAPADAGLKGRTYLSPYHPQDVRALVSLEASAPLGVEGQLSYVSPSGAPWPLSTRLLIYVYQCNGSTGSDCALIAAIESQQLGKKYLETSTKPYSPGHVYKACATVTDTDGWRLINACTGFTY